MRKHKKITERFFNQPRLEICRILVEEFTKLESVDKFKTEEFLRLVDRLSKIIK